MIVIHRISVSHVRMESPEQAARDQLPWRPHLEGKRWSNTPEGIRGFFEEVMGWRHPAYTAVLSTVWGRWQWADIGAATNHAGSTWARDCISVAHVGDWRAELPSLETWRQSVEEVGGLVWALGLVPTRQLARAGHIVREVSSHAELARAEGRDWRCPGAGWPIHRYRSEVWAEAQRLTSEIGPGGPEALGALGWR